MKRIRKLNIIFVIVVFLIMVSSWLISGLMLLSLYKFNLLESRRMAPAVMFFIICFISIIFGTIMSYVTGKHVLKPLNELIAATKEVAKGNYNIQVSNLNMDNELGDLIQNFNDMSLELSGVEMMHRDFINNFSHEFKTPIVSIRGFAKQLQNSSLTNDEIKEYTDIIIKESERLTNMSSNILLLTKLENQNIISNKVKFSLDEQLRHCILLLEKEWEAKNIELHLTLNPIDYYGDEEMLMHVWLNLIGNAIKYSYENGKIEVTCYETGNDVKVKIKDNGIGMTDEMIEHAFDKFYQGDLAHKTDGHGLGLSIVKRIIDLCGGKITVKSKEYNGSTFIVRLSR
ncbi:HAMP domain-containing histidine kinase [Tissierella sp. MSJ-40]|uniref:Heme sensor protein HssS n=1 Tax=Tissierella simiarum TaxID=2841534 RepID=A0ABS6E1U0_9FIRM|nr:HAMP domain-containing sensor histidine kinase [Tissierella simiarum]MBU5436811.1 HAMP domain-containing histidine kinase [Tissierella simiarum]